MDISRERDLYLLHERMNDTNLSEPKRVAAWRKFESIKAQIRDTKLNDLRHRLVRATIANDTDYIERIGEEIHAYTAGKHY